MEILNTVAIKKGICVYWFFYNFHMMNISHRLFSAFLIAVKTDFLNIGTIHYSKSHRKIHSNGKTLPSELIIIVVNSWWQ